MILILDSLQRKMAISHQNSSIHIHTVLYVLNIPHRKKTPPFKSQAHYILSAFWLFSFNEFCAVHYCSNKKTKKNMLLVDYMCQNTERHKTESQENLSLQGGE